MSLTALAEALTATGVLTEVQADEGFVHGDAVLGATGAEITLNVDPDPDEVGLELAVDTLVSRSVALLAVTPEQLGQVVAVVAEELEAALAEEEIEQVVDLREDLTVVALIAMPKDAGIVFLAPTQFPNGGITVVVDDAYEVQEIQLEGMDGGCEDCDCGSDHSAPDGAGFTSVDELREQLHEH